MSLYPLAVPKRICFAGDWHADLTDARNALERAELQAADVIIHTGDFGYKFEPKFVRGVNDELIARKLQLLFVEGNHEDHPWLLKQPIGGSGLRQIHTNIWHIPRGYRWNWDGVRFVGLGGAHSVDGMWRRQRGWMWHKEETITPAQAAAVMEGGTADVLVSHDCPAGVPIPGLTPEDFPVVEILRAEEHRELLGKVASAVKPRFIFHGHYHVAYETVADIGYGPVVVKGLDRGSASLNGNLHFVNLDQLKLVKELPK